MGPFERIVSFSLRSFVGKNGSGVEGWVVYDKRRARKRCKIWVRCGEWLFILYFSGPVCLLDVFHYPQTKEATINSQDVVQKRTPRSRHGIHPSPNEIFFDLKFFKLADRDTDHPPPTNNQTTTKRVLLECVAQLTL